MEINSKRRSATRSVVAGSVWESRMKMDEVKGGFKVFNGEEDSDEAIIKESGDGLNQNQSGVTGVGVGVGVGVGGGVGVVVRERRKTWKCEPVEVIGRNSILMRKIRAEDDGDESCEDFYDSTANVGVEKFPIFAKNKKADDEFSKEMNRSVDGIEKKSQILKKKSSRSRSLKELDKIKSRSDSVNGDGNPDVVVKEEIDMSSKKKFDVKEVKFYEQRSKSGLILKEKLNHIEKTQPPISVNKKIQQTLDVNHSSELRKPPPEELEIMLDAQNALDDIVELIMWRDLEKSALVFGIGMLVILLSSFTKDIKFSLLSILSYMGLLYLAAIFLYRTVLCRGSIDLNDSINTVGEEEAIWIVKLVLPYLNKFLLKLRLLFSGDPATTIKTCSKLRNSLRRCMSQNIIITGLNRSEPIDEVSDFRRPSKVAALLLVVARYGSTITLWRMAKLGFFGIFTLPKAYSWYSTQLNRDRNNVFQSLMDSVDTFLYKS